MRTADDAVQKNVQEVTAHQLPSFVAFTVHANALGLQELAVGYIHWESKFAYTTTQHKAAQGHHRRHSMNDRNHYAL